MKKAVPLLAILLVLAGVVVFTQRRTGGVGEKFPAGRAAELAPENSIAYVELPDLERARARWRENEVGTLVDSVPDGQWRDAVCTGIERLLYGLPLDTHGDGTVELGALLAIAAQAEKVDPAELFLAVAGTDGQIAAPMPKTIVGVRFRAKRSDVEAAVRGAKERLLQRWPGAKSELSTHQGIEFETITNPATLGPWQAKRRDRALSPGPVAAVAGSTKKAAAPPLPTVHLAFRDDWLFFATNRALLEGTLDRYLRRPEAGRSLTQNSSFVECRKHGSADADVVAWARWEAAGNAVAAKLTELSISRVIGAPNPLQAVLYTCVLAGPRSLDRLYFQLADGRVVPELPNRSITLAEAGTASREVLPGNLEGKCEWDGKAGYCREPYLPGWTPAELEEMGTVFGSQVAFRLQDPSDIWPDWVIALEIRDAAKAPRVATRIAERLDSSPPMVTKEWTRWTFQPGPPGVFRPPLVLTKTHLLFGASAASREASRIVVERVKAGALPAELPVGEAPMGMRWHFDAPKLWAEMQVQNFPRSQPAIAPIVIPTVLDTVMPTFRPWTPNEWCVGSIVTKGFASRVRPGTVSLRTEGPGFLAESTLGFVGNAVLLLWLRDP